MTREQLRENFFNNFTVNHSWALRATVVEESGFKMVKSQQIQDSGMQIVSIYSRIFIGNLQAKGIGSAVSETSLQAAARQPLGIAPGVVVATRSAFAPGGAGELGGPN